MHSIYLSYVWYGVILIISVRLKEISIKQNITIDLCNTLLVKVQGIYYQNPKYRPL